MSGAPRVGRRAGKHMASTIAANEADRASALYVRCGMCVWVYVVWAGTRRDDLLAVNGGRRRKLHVVRREVAAPGLLLLHCVLQPRASNPRNRRTARNATVLSGRRTCRRKNLSSLGASIGSCP